MIRRLTAMALFASLTLGFGLPAQASAAGAASITRNAAPAPAASPLSGQVEQAQYRDRDRRWRDDRRWRNDRRWRDDRRHYRPGPPPRSGFYFQFGTPPRYAPPPRYGPRHAMRLPVSHVRWCENRYRSYRASDNTFQPYNGPRRQCHSPYI